MGQVLFGSYLDGEFQNTPFVSGETEESYLARLQLRKVLVYSRLTSIVLFILGPVCLLTYPDNGRFWLGGSVLVAGVMSEILHGWVRQRGLARGMPVVASLCMTVVILIPAVTSSVCFAEQGQGRSLLFAALACWTWCLSIRQLWLHCAVYFVACGISFHLGGLLIGIDDIVVFGAAAPVAGWFLCSVNTQTLREAFRHQRDAEENQIELEQTLDQLRDETARRHVEEERRRESEQRLQTQHDELLHVGRLSAMGEMVAGISHELQQPLHSMSMYAGILDSLAAESDNPDAESIRVYTGKVVQLTQQNAEVIRRLQNFVRRGTSNRESVEIRQLILDAIELTSVEFRRLKVDVVTDLDAAAIRGEVDSVQLQQVIVNLVKNACDALAGVLPEERRIEISAMRDGETLSIRVRDSGTGLMRAEADRVFDTFYSTKVDGLGMGLAISRSIMEDHHGRIALRENHDGRGVTTTIELPVGAAAA